MEHHLTRPQELVAQRRRLPVAYLGLGILEWHGKRNPLGLRTARTLGPPWLTPMGYCVPPLPGLKKAYPRVGHAPGDAR